MAPPAPDERTVLPLRRGDHGTLVSVAQQRLRWLGYDISRAEITSKEFGPTTQGAVKAFQVKFWQPTGKSLTKSSWNELQARAGKVGVLPDACTEVASICISTDQKLVRWVEDGKVLLTTDARFGGSGFSTGTGSFRVTRKSRDHVSSLYRTAMPFALFFNGGQAVHYSAYFKRDGYYGASHGCVNIRDIAKAEWLFDRANVGDRVYVYG